MTKDFKSQLLLPGLLLSILAITGTAFCQKADPTVLLVSFDGFRYDFIDKHNLTHFKQVRSGGTAAEGLIPCYPSLTFPNHYSIVTGQRPATHGLVDNSFYDSALNLPHSISNRAAVTDARFYGGTPLWVLAKRSGMKTASYFWVGTEVADTSRAPDIFFPYDAKVSFGSRIDTVLSWLRKEGKSRPRFITLYFSEPDHIEHDSGPNSAETATVVHQLDSLLGVLTKGIKSINAPVNIILVSDHGMSELTVADETLVFLDELYDVRTKLFRTVASSTLAHLYVDKQSTLDSMFTLLKSKERNFKVYRRHELPTHWHYDHYRVGDLVIVSDPGHNIRHSDRQGYNQRMIPGSRFGVHGYDPTVVTDMRGIFLAEGPQIKKGLKLGLVRNIDIYPLVVRILGLKLPAIDGDPKALQKACVGK